MWTDCPRPADSQWMRRGILRASLNYLLCRCVHTRAHQALCRAGRPVLSICHAPGSAG